MERRFPAMLVLWLKREFYRGKYGMTGSSQAWTPGIGDKLGDEMWDLKGAGIFLISLLGPRSRFFPIIPCDVTACRGRLYKERLDNGVGDVDRLENALGVRISSWSFIHCES
ncbi:hypothetical protein AVEN_135241-1 [Araneus ventricosus]|uniref:Uncharacterized protein n=1 Tax=Araneus ventricosus TaxID=182803 RepID=A0A4Y2CPM4_ARAVE|nr:hypothetical protein AVEN_135241-1 [Araneus ventricosus]